MKLVLYNTILEVERNKFKTNKRAIMALGRSPELRLAMKMMASMK